MSGGGGWGHGGQLRSVCVHCTLKPTSTAVQVSFLYRTCRTARRTTSLSPRRLCCREGTRDEGHRRELVNEGREEETEQFETRAQSSELSVSVRIGKR